MPCSEGNSLTNSVTKSFLQISIETSKLRWLSFSNFIFSLKKDALIIKDQNICKYNNCYKIILDCNSHLEGFYQKNGFENKNIQMSYYFD